MKTIQPLRLSSLTRPYQYAGQCYLGVTVFVLWDFTEGHPIAEGGQALWEIFKDESVDVFGAQTLDFGIPKQQAELIVNGYGYGCYAKDGRTAVEVSLNNIKKSLWVSGDRYWVNHKMSPALDFEKIAISWRNAYGGPEYPENLVGKGHKVQDLGGEKVQLIPNIEDPSYPIRDETSHYVPAGLSALPIEMPNRHLMMGTYDEKWRQEDYPGFARDIDWCYFNQAPQDQYLNHLKAGDRLSFIHMHPEKSIVSASIPDWIVRGFIKKAESGEQITGTLQTIDFALTTVWAYPHREQAILVYQANVQIMSDDADEISHIMFALEHPDDPHHMDYYETVLEQRLDPKLGAMYAALDKTLIDKRYMRPLAIELLPVSQQLKNKMKYVDRELSNTQEELKKMQATLPKSPMPESDDIKSLRLQKEQTEQESAEQIAIARQLLNGELSFDELIELQIEQAKKMPDYSAKRQQLRKQLAEIKEKHASMTYAEQVEFFEQTENDSFAEKIFAYKPAVLSDVGAYQDKQDAQLAVDEENKAVKALRESEQKQHQLFEQMRQRHCVPMMGKGLAQDISVVEESGKLVAIDNLNFFRQRLHEITEGFVLRHTYAHEEDYRQLMSWPTFVHHTRFTQCDFHEANLQHCRFRQVVFQSCDFTKADISFTVFEDCQFINCKLVDVTNHRLDLKKVEFTSCELATWMHSKLFIEHVRFDTCRFESFSFLRARVKQLHFENSHLSRVSFVNTWLKGLSFEQCRIDSLAISGTRQIQGLRLHHSQVEKCFIQSKTTIYDVELKRTQMKDSCWREMVLPKARFIESDISRNEFSKTQFHHAVFHTVSAKDSLFIRSDFSAATLQNVDFAQTICKSANFSSTTLDHVSFFRAELALIKTDYLTSQKDCWLEQANVYPRLG